MKQQWEYRIFNMSEGGKQGKWFPILQDLGSKGWEVCFQLRPRSFLLKRDIEWCQTGHAELNAPQEVEE